MSFFDSKQEIINIELTQYGKYLLSKGKFQPYYYSFFDDDVLYDAKHASVTESQNAAQTRILEETPISKPVYNVFSVSIKAKEQEQLIINEDLEGLKKSEEGLRRYNDAENIVLAPLGKSSPNSKYYPAWNLKVLSENSKIDTTDSSLIIENPVSLYKNFYNIPQVNMVTGSYKIFSKEKMDDVTSKENILVEIGISRDKNVILTGNADELTKIFDILEKNVEDNNKNFELEVFLEDEELLPNGEKRKIWKKLYFFKKPTNIKNNILLDEYIYKEASYATPDETNVEYYLDILVDEEIDLPEDAKVDTSGIYQNPAQTKPFGEDC